MRVCVCAVNQCEDAVQLVRDAIAAGIVGDLGSGSNVDICVITEHKAQLLRPFDSHVVDLHAAADRAGSVSKHLL